MPPRRLAHVLSIAALACVTIAWLWPLLRQADAVVPGAGAGDNLTFVWDAWWMREAWRTGASFLTCPMIFAPFGADLTLHTHAALSSAAAALVSPGGSIVAATNAVVAVHLCLNLVAAYALAWRVTRQMAASLLAAVVFGWSPYVTAHLLGHFNLVAAWVLPLCALLTIDALERPRWKTLALLGVTLGGAAYLDYYYAVYCGAIVVVLLLQRRRAPDVTPLTARDQPAMRARHAPDRYARPRGQTMALRVIVVLLLIDVGVIIATAATGGAVFMVGRLRISAVSTANPAAVAGILGMAWLAVAWLPGRWSHVDREGVVRDMRRLAVSVVVAFVVCAPLLVSAARLWHRGDYVTQRYRWRSAPAGIDAGTWFLGNPGGALWNGVSARAYSSLHIDGVEQAAWLGPGLLCLCGLALVRRRQDRQVGRWAALGGVFLVWALGPYIVVFGTNTHVMLPATLVRYLPLVANARIPSRAIVVVYLAASMLAAIALASLRARGRTTLAMVLGCAVVADFLPARPPLFRLDHPPIYDVLARQPAGGTVCELPLGLRDGFGETGRFDARVLWYQTLHGHPITGGFLARLPPRVIDGYERDAVLGPLLRLSGGAPLAKEPPADRSAMAAALAADDIRYVIVNRPNAAPDLLAFVRIALPLRILAEDTDRTLYAVVR